MDTVAKTSFNSAEEPGPLPSVYPQPPLVWSSEASTLELGGSLIRKCANIAAKFGRAESITVTCAAAREELPRATAVQLELIAAELLASAIAVFERNRGGGIGITFAAAMNSLDVTVEHSRPKPGAASCHGVASSWLARTIVGRLGGRIEHAIVIGGARTVVSVPRP